MTIEQEISQAVARGWCHPSNSAKTMDLDLVRAITQEVLSVICVEDPAKDDEDEKQYDKATP